MAALFKPSASAYGFTVTLTGAPTTAPVASVTLTVKILVPALAGVAEKTRLKLPSKVNGNWLAPFGDVKVTGFVPPGTQVSIAVVAFRFTSEYASFAQTQPAGNVTATLFAAAQPLLLTSQLNSTFVLEAFVMVGLTTMSNVPRSIEGDAAGGVVFTGDALVAEPVKVNGLVATAVLS